MKRKIENLGKSTKAIHIGSEPDLETGAIIPPIYQTSTYVQDSPGKHKGYEYSRTHNPTRKRLEECLASLEEGKFCNVTSSGLSSAQIVLQSLRPGSLVLSGDDVYGGTFRLFTKVFHNTHTFIFADSSLTENFIQQISERKPDLIWLETPSNPLLKICDLNKICRTANKLKIPVIVDNTFASPFFQNPLNMGADIVLHSMTKYINGHSDIIGGALITNSKEFYEKFFFLQNSMGPCLSPFDCWLTLRGLKTLSVRMERHQENAMILAQWLSKQKKIERVIYPGLKSHSQHLLAKKQMKGFGGMITFYLKGGIKESKRFLSSLSLFSLAESLGGVESLIEHPAIMTHASIPKNIRKNLGIDDNLIRISVGIEDIDDLIKDFQYSLSKF